MSKIINLYGGPGTGKSTCAAKLYTYMKEAGYSVELVREYAKDLAWKGTKITDDMQLEIASNQYAREKLLYNTVDFIITDSPTFLSHFYTKHYQNKNYMLPVIKHLEAYKKELGITEYNVFLTRHKQYDPRGRYETEEQARQIDEVIKQECPITHTVSAVDHATILFNHIQRGIL